MIWISKFSKMRLLPLLIAITWTIVLTIILLQPENQPIIPTGVQAAPSSLKRELFFSSLHLLTFGFTAWIWCFALNLHRDSGKLLFSLVILLLVYGFSVEYLQSMIPGRNAQWWDMLANGIGICVGLFLWDWFQSRQIAVIRHFFG